MSLYSLWDCAKQLKTDTNITVSSNIKECNKIDRKVASLTSRHALKYLRDQKILLPFYFAKYFSKIKLYFIALFLASWEISSARKNISCKSSAYNRNVAWANDSQLFYSDLLIVGTILRIPMVVRKQQKCLICPNNY